MDLTPETARALAAALVGQGDVARFDADIREQQPAFFRAALAEKAASGLFDLSRLEQALNRSDGATKKADIYAVGHMLRLSDIHHRSGKTPATVAAEHLGQGATIRFRDIDQFDPILEVFSAAIAQVYASVVQINAYLTPPAQTGFPPHFDNTDVFILQVVGSKEWCLHRDYTNRVPLPDPDTPWDPDGFRPIGPEERHRLDVGDVLYLPRGEMHSARCTDEASLHLTISLTPLSVADLLVREVRRLSRAEEGLRRRAPWSAASETPQDERQLTETLQYWLHAVAARLDPEASLQNERAALRQNAADVETKATDALHRCLAQLRADEGSIS